MESSHLLTWGQLHAVVNYYSLAALDVVVPQYALLTSPVNISVALNGHLLQLNGLWQLRITQLLEPPLPAAFLPYLQCIKDVCLVEYSVCEEAIKLYNPGVNTM